MASCKTRGGSKKNSIGRTHLNPLGILVITWIVLLLFAPGWAQESGEDGVVKISAYALEPITVTAEKREQDLQEVPSSISVLDSETLESAGIKTVTDLWLTVPNFYILDYDDTFEQTAFIRGIKGAVGFNVDGVNYFGGVSGMLDIPLIDIERIEVLRGPQGTLYGGNTEGGVVNIITKKPDNENHVSASGTVGSDGLWGGRGALRLPLLEDKLYFGFSGGFEYRDGFTHNDYLGEDVDDKEKIFARANLRWQASDNLDVLLTADKDRYEMGVVTYAKLATLWDDPYHVSYNEKGNDTREIWGTQLKIDYDMCWSKLTSITAYREWDQNFMNDGDWTPENVYTWKFFADQRQITQELRLTSNNGDFPLKWLAGTYFWDNEDKRTDDIIYGADNTYGMPAGDRTLTYATTTSEGYAFFGQATYTLFDKLDLTAGLRWENEKKEKTSKDYYESPEYNIENSLTDTYDEDIDYSELLPKATAAFRINENLMPYVSIAKGYKSGGFNRSFVTSAMTYEPEYTWNYEAGVKTTWLDNRLMINAALFYVDYTDMQISQADPSSGRWYTSNAGEAHSQGGEIEAAFRPFDGLDISAGLGFADAKYDKYEADDGVDYSDNTVVQAPNFNYNAAVQYRRPLLAGIDLVSRVDVQGIGERYWDDANTESSDPFTLVNLRLGFVKDSLELAFLVKNLFDTEYEKMAFDYNGLWASPGEPLTFAVTMTAKF